MIDYITLGISLTMLFLYFMTIILLIKIKSKLTPEAGRAFIFAIITVLLLAIRRVQQVFIESSIIKSIPYFLEITSFLLAFFFFLSALTFYRSLKRVSSKSSSQRFNDYKKGLGKKLFR